MRKELLTAVKDIPAPPPVIHPAKKPNSPAPVQQTAPQSPAPVVFVERQSEIVHVLRVTADYRDTGLTKLGLVLSRQGDRKTMPAIRVKPGMLVKITVIEKVKNGGGDAKK